MAILWQSGLPGTGAAPGKFADADPMKKLLFVINQLQDF